MSRVLLAVLAALLLAIPAFADEGKPDTVLTNLKKMDTELDGLLALKIRDLKGNAVEGKIRELEKLKRAALGGFPQVWGIDFVTVYDKLEEIDDMLARKPPLVGMAWRASDELEKELRDNGKGVPKGASQGVYELTRELDKLLSESKHGDFAGKEDEFVKRAREIAAKKKTLIVSELPKLFGHSFWKWFSPLEDIDHALHEALLSDNVTDRHKLLERAKKLKEPLLGLLEVQECEKGKAPARVPCPPITLPQRFSIERPEPGQITLAHVRIVLPARITLPKNAGLHLFLTGSDQVSPSLLLTGGAKIQRKPRQLLFDGFLALMNRVGGATDTDGGPLVLLSQALNTPADFVGKAQVSFQAYPNALGTASPASFCNAGAADIATPFTVAFFDPNTSDKGLPPSTRMQLAQDAAQLCGGAGPGAVNQILGAIGGGLIGEVPSLGATFTWSLVSELEVQGIGSFTGPAGETLSGIQIAVPSHTITNFLCPSQLPDGELVGGALVCTGGTLPVGDTFQANLQTSPAPSTGMGGQLYGRVSGSSTFTGPFTITGPPTGLLGSPARGDVVVHGCRIVSHPTSRHHTRCPGANLRRASLHNANLRYADLRRADLSRADLSHANLTHANLTRANLRGANLRGARFCATTMPDGSKNNSGCGRTSGQAASGGGCRAAPGRFCPSARP